MPIVQQFDQLFLEPNIADAQAISAIADKIQLATATTPRTGEATKQMKRDVHKNWVRLLSTLGGNSHLRIEIRSRKLIPALL